MQSGVSITTTKCGDTLNNNAHYIFQTKRRTSGPIHPYEMAVMTCVGAAIPHILDAALLLTAHFTTAHGKSGGNTTEITDQYEPNNRNDSTSIVDSIVLRSISKPSFSFLHGHHTNSERSYNQYIISEAATVSQRYDGTSVAIPITDRHRGGACGNEDLPVCNLISHDIYGDYPYMFESAGHGLVDRVVPVFKISQLHGACVIDPFSGVDIDHQATTPISVEVEIHCQSPKTRVAFRPSINLNNTAAFAFLVSKNCSLYWNDLSIFGQHINFLVWMPSGWRDEFVDGHPEYFYDCVHDVVNNTDGGKEIRPPIPGLQNLVSIIMHYGKRPQTPSPVFTRYLWPNMAEGVLSGWVSIFVSY